MPQDLFAAQQSSPNQPVDLFAGMGIEPQKKTSIPQDIISSIANVPGKLWDMATTFPGEALGLAKQVATGNPRVGANIISGLASGGAGLLNTPANIRDYLAQKDLISQSAPSLRLPDDILPKDYDYRQKLLDSIGLPSEQQPGDALTFGTAQYAPAAITGNLPSSLALSAIGQNQSPITAALLPSAAKGVGKAAAKIPPAVDKAVIAAKNIDVTPSGLIAKYVGNKLSLPELAANLEAAKGTETPLGDVIGSPTLKKFYENTVVPNPFSGGDETLGRIGSQVQQRADDLVNNQLDKTFSGQDANPLVKSLLDQAYKSHQTVKNNLYNGVNDLADKEGVQLQLPTFTKLAGDNADAIQNSPLLQNDAAFKNSYNRLRGLQQAGTEVTNAAPAPSSIKDAKLIANGLYTNGAQMLKSPNAVDRQQGGLYKSLAASLRDDVNHTIETQGSHELKNQYQEAENYYKDDFVQFLDKDLYKLLGDKAGAQTIIRNIIKPGKTLDKYELIDKVQNILPDDQQNLLGYSYLKGAMDKNGVLRPQKVSQLINSLGNRQFESLFPKQTTRDSINQFMKIKNMNNEALNFLANPKTGARNLQFLDQLTGAIIPTITGGVGYTVGGGLGGLLGVAAGSVAKGKTANYLNKLLTSEDFRQKVINKKAVNAAQSQGASQ